MIISGLASGFDFEKLVNDLMAIERQPVQKLELRKADLISLKSTWDSIAAKTTALHTSVKTLMDTTFLNALTATSSDTTLLTATASSTATKDQYSIVVNNLATAHKVASKQILSAVGLSGTFTISGDSGAHSVSVTVSPTDTLQNIADKINQAFSTALNTAGTSFPYVSAKVIANQLVLTRSDTGNVAIQVSDGGTTLLEDLGITVAGTNDTTFANQLVAPGNASITIDGIAYSGPSNIITDAIPGLTINLLRADSTKTVTVTVATDQAGITAKINDFITNYNAHLDLLAQQTDKGGKLTGDSTARSLQYDIRNQLTSRVQVGTDANGLPIYSSLIDIGIKTIDNQGHLSFDSTKFFDALAKDPTKVKTLMGNIMTPLEARLNAYIMPGGLYENKDKAIDAETKRLQDTIDRLNRQLDLRQKYLMAKYVELEKVLSQMQNQSAWLANQVKSLTPTTTTSG